MMTAPGLTSGMVRDHAAAMEAQGGPGPLGVDYVPGPLTWQLLLPTIPHRHDLMCGLLAEIGRQHQPGLGVLVLRDNLQRPHVASYGKWQDLEEMAWAEYTSFISDDDWIAPGFVSRVMGALETGPDYVGFPVKYTVDGERTVPVDHSLRHAGWDYADGVYIRDITHYNPIRREFALLATWQTDHQEADRTWSAALRATGKVRTEVYIDEEMYWYQETGESWSRRLGSWPEPLPPDQIPPVPRYPWLTVRDECVPS